MQVPLVERVNQSDPSAMTPRKMGFPENVEYSAVNQFDELMQPVNEMIEEAADEMENLEQQPEEEMQMEVQAEPYYDEEE